MKLMTFSFFEGEIVPPHPFRRIPEPTITLSFTNILTNVAHLSMTLPEAENLAKLLLHQCNQAKETTPPVITVRICQDGNPCCFAPDPEFDNEIVSCLRCGKP